MCILCIPHLGNKTKQNGLVCLILVKKLKQICIILLISLKRFYFYLLCLKFLVCVQTVLADIIFYNLPRKLLWYRILILLILLRVLTLSPFLMQCWTLFIYYPSVSSLLLNQIWNTLRKMLNCEWNINRKAWYLHKYMVSRILF